MSGVAGTRLYTAQVCELFRWVNSVTIHYYWRWRRSRIEILELCLGPRDVKTELGSFFIHFCESGAEAFLLVNKQSNVVSIINVRESVLANLDADFTTDTTTTTATTTTTDLVVGQYVWYFLQ